MILKKVFMEMTNSIFIGIDNGLNGAITGINEKEEIKFNIVMPTIGKPNRQNIALSIHLHLSTDDYWELKAKADLGIRKRSRKKWPA